MLCISDFFRTIVSTEYFYGAHESAIYEHTLLMYDAKKLKEIEKSLAAWAKKTQELIDKRPEREERFETLSGIPVERVYTPLSAPESDYM